MTHETKLLIVEQLRSGFDNVDGGELGGVLLTMKKAADTIDDLYAALDALDHNGHTQQTWRNAKSAMAKARGERAYRP